jgi:hypothetical protein
VASSEIRDDPTRGAGVAARLLAMTTQVAQRAATAMSFALRFHADVAALDRTTRPPSVDTGNPSRTPGASRTPRPRSADGGLA